MKKKKKFKPHLVAEKMSEEEAEVRRKKQRKIIEEVKAEIVPNGKKLAEWEEIIKIQYKGMEILVSDKDLYRAKLNIAMNISKELPEIDEIIELEDFYNKREKEAIKTIEGGLEFDIITYEFEGEDNAVLQIDRKHDYITMSNCSRKLSTDIILSYGVFKEDIEEETSRFHSYVFAYNYKKNSYKELEGFRPYDT